MWEPMIKYYLLCVLTGLDVFLFFTGNPSVISYLLGGFYFLHIIVVPYIAIMGIVKAKDKNNKEVLIFLSYIVLLITISIFFNKSLVDYSKENISNLAAQIIVGGRSDIIYSESSLSLKEVDFDEGSIVIDNYYPLERRADFFVNDKKGNRYELIVTLTGFGNVNAHFIQKK